MHFTLTSLATLSALLAGASATLSFGKFQGQYAAWIEGEGDCEGNGITLIEAQNNPCGTPFTLNNGYTYTLEGCGTDDFALYNGDGFGSYNAKCNFNEWTSYCNCWDGPLGNQVCVNDVIEQQWLC
jgi:hypothetical protein